MAEIFGYALERKRAIIQVLELRSELPISRSIVEAHRGRLSVSSNPGRGTTFEISLPYPN